MRRTYLLAAGCVLALTPPLVAEHDVSAILNRFVAAQTRNDEQARQYTYVEDADFFTYEDGGSLRKDRSETHEIVFLEGLQFRKLIARNGKPLDAREEARVKKEMQDTAEYRRKHRPPPAGGRIGFGNRHADLGSNQELLALFDSRVAGEEEIRGRKAWVIECIPRAGRSPANEHEREVLVFRKQLWIGQDDDLLLRAIDTVVAPGIPFALPGSTITVDFEKLNDGVHVPASVTIVAYHKVDNIIRPSRRTEYRNSQFRKFDVRSTITISGPGQ